MHSSATDSRDGLIASTLAVTLILALTVPASSTPAQQPSVANLVTYGPEAATREGDQDYVQVFYIRVPEAETAAVGEPAPQAPETGDAGVGEMAGETGGEMAGEAAVQAAAGTSDGTLYLRLFDPDTGGDHDALYGEANTRTRFALYGGPGAFTAPTATDPLPSDTDLSAGTLLGDSTFGRDAAADSTWTVLAAFSRDDGELVDGARVFKLIVRGMAGDDGNLFAFAVSLRDHRNMAPEGLRITTYSPTVRVPRGELADELVLRLPEEPGSVSVHSFDGADAELSFETTFRSVEVDSSGQDEWREDTVRIEPEETGDLAAILFRGGTELPNDATFYVTASDGRTLPVELPIRQQVLNRRPQPGVEIRPLADCVSVSLDASGTVDADGDDLTYEWEFGDGRSASGPVQVHAYDGPGAYRATLRVTDSSGQIGNGTRARYPVTVNRRPTVDAGADLVAAPGEVVAFDGSGSRDADGSIIRYVWDFGDDGRSEGVRVERRFAEPGRYRVTLEAEDDSGSPCNVAADSLEVWINESPVAEAGPSRTISPGDEIRLDGSRSFDPDGSLASYRWDLGEGTTLSGPAVEHTYTTSGRYEVTLTVRDDADVANSAASDSVTVFVNRAPVADAGVDRRAAAGEVIEFDATSSTDPDGQIRDYAWDFGDGGRAAGARATYAYAEPGRYEVGLTVRDDSGSATDTSRDSIVVLVNAPPIADAGEDRVVTASEVRFEGRGSTDPDGEIAAYHWEFGDGGAGDEPDPVHAYRRPGTYRVRLTVTDDSGTVRNTDTDEMTVRINAAPVADAGRDRVAAPGQEIELSAAESFDPDGDIVEFSWEFGDGTTASGRTARHAFERAGTYAVMLTVADDTGHPRAVDYDEATVFVNAPPVADAGPDVLIAPVQEVTLSGADSLDPDGEIAAWRWEFSDGAAPASGMEVARSFERPGTYSARLAVTDDSGAINGVGEDEVTIHVNHPPVADPGRDVTTWEHTVTLEGRGSVDPDGDPLTYVWDFGDGSPPASGPRVTHTYEEGGTYPVVLTVDDGTSVANGSHSAAMSVRVLRAPVADAGPDRAACAGEPVLFDGGYSVDPEGGVLRYRWEFGDGAVGDGVNPTKTYLEGGVYPVTLTVRSDVAPNATPDTDQAVVTVAESPIADAGADQRVCANTEVRFDGTGSWDQDGVVNRYAWDFGDGTSGGGATPGHVYSEPGTYRVLLTIFGDPVAACDNSHTDEMAVTVVEAPVAAFEIPSGAAAAAEVLFDGSPSTGAQSDIHSWEWDFGDGTTGQGELVHHTYGEPGRYIATLTIATDESNTACRSVSTQRALIVNARPVADAGEDLVVGVGEEVVLSGAGSSDDDGAIASYRWGLGDGTTASGIDVRHRYREPGRYPVRLTVTDDTDLPNNSAGDGIEVIVNHPPTPVIDVEPRACPGGTVTFDAGRSGDADGRIVRYVWHFGDGTTDEGPRIDHAFDRPGAYGVTLTVIDDAGVDNSEQDASATVRVNRAPAVDIRGPVLACTGRPVPFDGSGSFDRDGEPLSYQWDMGDGSVLEGAAVEHVFREAGHRTVRLQVTDDSGTACAAAADSLEVRVDAAPVAEAGPDKQIYTGAFYDAVFLDASRSRDPDGDPLTYHWDFGDGQTGTGVRLFHQYAEPGEYVVRLRVRDNSGEFCDEGVDEVAVTVRARDED